MENAEYEKALNELLAIEQILRVLSSSDAAGDLDQALGMLADRVTETAEALRPCLQG